MTTLMLVRHGQTVDNRNQVLQGQTQGELDEKGLEQARQLACQLEREKIDVFMSSDLKRAFDTCAVIAGPHGARVITTPLLRERDWGGFTGRFIPDIQKEVWPDDVETMGQMKERARQFLRMLRSGYDGKTVLAVGHGIINKVIQSVYYGKPPHEIPKMGNAEVRILQL